MLRDFPEFREKIFLKPPKPLIFMQKNTIFHHFRDFQGKKSQTVLMPV